MQNALSTSSEPYNSIPKRLEAAVVDVLALSVPFGLGLTLLACSGGDNVTSPNDTKVASVVVTPSNLSLLSFGDTATLSATAMNAGGDAISGASFTWASSDENVVTVSSTGEVTAVADGTATVSASTDGVSGSASVGVTQVGARLAFQVQPGTAEGQEPFGVTVAIEDANGHVVTGATDQVDVALAAYPAGSSLAGTTAVAATGGLATFDDLSLALPGQGYTLEAASGTLTPDTTDPFDVRLTFAELAVQNGRHSCGLTSAGHAYCWGQNAFGVLGDGSTTNRPSPVPVLGGQNFVALSTGTYHTCALTGDGTAYCWGSNGYGDLGDGGTTASAAPVAVSGGHTFKAIEAGFQFTCGIASTDITYCWGSNNDGELGNGTTTGSPVPTQVAGGLTFVQITAGVSYACGLTDTQKAYCWGYGGGTGQLGDGQSGSVSVPDSVWYDGAYAAIRAGGNHTCAVTPDRQAMCWGNGGNGQLGTNSTNSASVPEFVSTSLRFVAVVPGGYHTCGIATTGSAYCWGLNDKGQLGTGTLVADSVPAAVTGGLTFTDIGAGFDHTCALTDGSRAYCWGANYYGQLGVGTNADSAVPVEVKQ
jgi:alpha-tubulin suppressor-like RCC1 family protein